MRMRRIAFLLALSCACYGDQRLERRLRTPRSSLTLTNREGVHRAAAGRRRGEASSSGDRLTIQSTGVGSVLPKLEGTGVNQNPEEPAVWSSISPKSNELGSSSGRGFVHSGDGLAQDRPPHEDEPSVPFDRQLEEDNDPKDDSEETEKGEGDGDGGSDANVENAADEEDEDECGSATTCADCALVSLMDDGSLCWWNGTLCQEENLDSGHDVSKMCLEGGAEPDSAPSPDNKDGDVSKEESRAGESTTPSMAPATDKSDATPETSSPTAKPVEGSTPAPSVKTTPAPTPMKTTPAPVAATVTKPPTAAPNRPTSAPVQPTSDGEDAEDDLPSGGTTAMLVGVVLLVGVVVCLRRRGSTVGASRGAGGFGSPPSQPSYQGVATSDDDEEWGWGDEEAQQADVELASKKVELEPSQQAARKGMSLKGGGIGGLPKKSPPPVPKSRMSASTIRSRERESSISIPDSSGFPSSDASYPVAPPSSPSRGANPSMYRPALSPPPLTTGATPPTSQSGPPPPPPPKKSDDIFAELGLSANPTFAKPVGGGGATSRPTAAPASGGASPWHQKVATAAPPRPPQLGGSFPAASGSASTTTASAASSALYRQPISMDDIASSTDANQQWDDDADLDDLLDD